MSNRNLLQETIEDIKDSGHTIEDIIFIGNREGYSCTWEEFTLLANQEYDAGFGAQEVAYDLVIVFSDGVYMERHEYDGSENWVVIRPFKIPEIRIPIHKLFVNGVGWESLKEINEGRQEEEIE